ncbi:hypothetical protein EV644_101700 [Kribbella orskensis]|uniref:TAP-like protein n=1 Tax=Kribbella orskensis TaxID=2512216 RepID=A0ABY2BVN4_9ACTN|nr:hypothetical protein EV642_101289 [Kribbella sp. VKM Ac-2500]TCO32057.1 hypothetical protein EV644_101700 [Kribbella orskensis]
MLRRATVAQLAQSLLGPASLDPDGIGSPETQAARHAIESAATHLRRPGAARRTAQWLHDAQQRAERSNPRELLRSCRVPAHLIVGDQDPFAAPDGTTNLTTIPTAGHNPQLSHPALVAAAIKTFADQTRCLESP